jgi:cyclopropane-fatty-acyl-phospholipid synthase
MNAISKAIQTALHRALSVFDELLGDYPEHEFQVRLWDGTTWGHTATPRFTLVLKRPEAMRKLFLSPNEFSLGEAFIAGEFDVEGDIEAAFGLGDYLLSKKNGLGLLTSLSIETFEKLSPHSQDVADLPGPKLSGIVHSRRRDRAAIRYHYDLLPEFFALWLDPYMLYSSAYFTDDTDLDSAQERKLDYICKKLRLQTGDHLLDIGCGWGGLLVYAAKHFGVDALGITLSVRQAETARARIHDACLEKHCRVEVSDYRELELSQQFDKVVSIGMFEHVGKALLPEYFGRAWHLLRPGGVFLNSGIASVPSRIHKGPSFVDRYVFPDGELVPLGTSIAVAETTGFEVRDVESLREHYAMTLREWVRRLENHADEAKRLTDEVTYRIWRLYMAGSAHQFRLGDLNLYQILLAKPSHGDAGVPLTRTDWYCSEQSRASDPSTTRAQ